MGYTIDIQPIAENPGFCSLKVTFENGFEAETSVKGDEAKTQWYAENAFIPDLLRIYPELRGEV